LIAKQRLEQKNRIAFIVFDSTLEIAFKEYLVNESGASYNDAKLLSIFGNRSTVHAEIKKYINLSKDTWKKIEHYYRLRCKLVQAGAAAMSLVLAAHALGYGANWITEWYAYDHGVLDALGLAQHERIAGFIHIGRPPGPPRIGRGRRSMRSQSALPLSCPEADRSLQGERRANRSAALAP
jgi:nitroreductase